jgi:hypothetical protein
MSNGTSSESCMHLFSVRLGDKLLAWAKNTLTPSRYDAASAGLEIAGHWALIVAAAGGLLFAIIKSIKTDTMSDFLMGIGWVVLIMVAQYVAGKLSATELLLIKSAPSEMSSRAFLSCLALLNLIAGILALVWFIVMAIRMEEWSMLGAGVGLFVLCELVVCLCLNPDMINITISSSSSPGQEALGVLALVMKGLLRLVPVAFGIGAICGAMGMIWMIVQLLRDQATSSSLMSLSTAWLVLVSAALPFVSYLLYIFVYLNIDLMRSILVLPGKVDALKSRGPAVPVTPGGVMTLEKPPTSRGL